MNFKKIFKRDYMNYYADRVMSLRQKIQRTNLKLLKLLLIRRYKRLLFRCQSFLPLSKAISNKIVFPHGLSGVFISNGAIIGDGCVIFQQVTIDSNALKDSKSNGSPVIGKNCYIGAGAKIIGNVSVGNNVRIGANAVVVKDVPDNTTVVGGGDFRMFQHDYDLDNDFVVFSDGKEKKK